MGVDLRGGQALVAQHLLHRAQVAAGVEQVGGEAVAQGVRGDGLEPARAAQPAFEQERHARVGEAPAAVVEEERALALGGARAALAQVLPQAGEGGIAHRHEPLPGALAHDPHEPRNEIHVPHVEGRQLRAAQAAGVEQLQDGAVPLPESRAAAARPGPAVRRSRSPSGTWAASPPCGAEAGRRKGPGP